MSQDQTLIKYEYLISQINFLFNLPLSLLAVLLFFQCTVAFYLAMKARILYNTFCFLSSTFFKVFKKFFELDLCCSFIWCELDYYTTKISFCQVLFQTFQKFFEEVLCCTLPFDKLVYYTIKLWFCQGVFKFILSFKVVWPLNTHQQTCSHRRDTLNGVSRQLYSPAASDIASQCYSAYAEWYSLRELLGE